MASLTAASLAGGSAKYGRVSDDYYATPVESTDALLSRECFSGTVLEPCIGGGHIAEVLLKNGLQVYGIDIVDRGYPSTTVSDFLTHDFGVQTFDNVITNPPYSLAQEFLEKSFTVCTGKVAMFLKIQFLEGVRRKEFFSKYPPRRIYVFSKRQSPLRNGSAVDESGKPWASTMCFAWFIWEHGYTGKPEIEWI